MAILELTGQSLERDDIAPKLLKLKNLMNQRKIIWDKLPIEKKKAWVASGQDPIMQLAWDVFNYIRGNFFYEGDEG